MYDVKLKTVKCKTAVTSINNIITILIKLNDIFRRETMT